MTTIMAIKTVIVDLTNQPDRLIFSGSSSEDIAYAKTFWQSLQLLPPMESRLVSSDIKQRLRVMPSGYSGYRSANQVQRSVSEPQVIKEFLSRAKTQENLDEYEKLREYASARNETREALSRSRRERMKKEELSRPYIPSRDSQKQSDTFAVSDGHDGDEDDRIATIRDLDKFDKLRNDNEPDSD